MELRHKRRAVWRYPLRCGSVETDPDAYMQISLLARSCNLEQPCTVKTDGLFYHRVVILVAWLILASEAIIIYKAPILDFQFLFRCFTCTQCWWASITIMHLSDILHKRTRPNNKRGSFLPPLFLISSSSFPYFLISSSSFFFFQNEEKRRKLVVSYNKPLVPSKPCN